MKEHAKVQALLTLAAAGALDPPDQQRVEAHLRDCEECRTELGGWNRLTATLKQLPTPQARPTMVLQTRRLLEICAADSNGFYKNRVVPALLILFSWVTMLLTFRVVRFFDMPVANWLDVSSTTVWIAFIGVTWMATALSASLIVKRSRQEGRTI